MAFTITKKLPSGQPDVLGAYVQGAVIDATFDNSYAAGGVSLVAGDFGFPSTATLMQVSAHPTGGLIFSYDYTNKKLQAFYPTGGATTSPAALADPKVTTGASTASAVDATTPNITPGKAKEVKASTDLSTITVRVFAFAVLGI